MRNRLPSRGVWLLLALGVIVCGFGFLLPRVHPVPRGADSELVSLRSERDSLRANDDASLIRLRGQVGASPSTGWSEERFTSRVGSGWRVEWLSRSGLDRAVQLSRTLPRMEEWSAYLRFIREWETQPGAVLETLDVRAGGAARIREINQVTVGLRVQFGESDSTSKNDTLFP